MSSKLPANQTFGVERHSIDPIPPEERHGRAMGLFPVWFGANLQLTTLITGALALVLGLSVVWGLVAIVIGNGVGAIFMALHSAQGPRLGIPQMIQSRAQFGFYGAIIPIVIVILMYVGFFASSSVLGGQALSDQSGLPINWSIGLLALVCLVITIFGYRLIHVLERISSVLSACVFIGLTAVLLTSRNIGGVWHPGAFNGGPFILMITIAATWQISYAPYVADYSRYLPKTASIRACFWWTYGASVVASIWMMAFGAIAAAVSATSFAHDSTGFVLDLASAGAVRWLAMIALVGGVVAVNVLNLYGGFMSVTTTMTAIREFHVGRLVRGIVVTVVAAVGTFLAVLGRTSFIPSYTNFILFLTYFLAPWTAINLVDFYLVRKEKYNIPAIFHTNGEYGRFAWRALLAYGAGVLIEIPFMSTTIYQGALVRYLGGADVSWILGIVLSAAIYFFLCRKGTEISIDPEAVDDDERPVAGAARI